MSLLMEGADTRKRKINFLDEEDEDEDIKIEKFFALIRSAKDIRDQLLDVEGSKQRVPKKAVATTATTTATTTAKKAEGSQRVYKKPPPPSASAKEKIPIADAGVSVAVATSNGNGSGSSNCSAKICRSSASEEHNNKGGTDYNTNENSKNSGFQQGRIFLDLNLSL